MNENAQAVWKAWLDGKTVQFSEQYPICWKNESPSEVDEHLQPQNLPDRWRIAGAENQSHNIWLAWIEGKTVQFSPDYASNEWRVQNPSAMELHNQPQNRPHNWRIKPLSETKTIFYKVAIMDYGKGDIRAIAYNHHNYDFAENSKKFICWDTDEMITKMEVEI